MHYQDFKNSITIIYNKHTLKVKLSILSGAKITLFLGLSESLGFTSGDYANENEPTCKNILKVFQSPNVADPNSDLKSLYIYSDIVEPPVVGHTVATMALHRWILFSVCYIKLPFQCKQSIRNLMFSSPQYKSQKQLLPLR